MGKLDRLQRLDLVDVALPPSGRPGAAIRLDADEAAEDWPAALKAVWLESFAKAAWNRYPGGHLDLTRALAEHVGVDADWIVLGAGADELLRDAMLAWGWGRSPIYAVPTDPRYGHLARTLGLQPIAVLRAADFGLPVEQLIANARRHDAGVVLIGNPNNPTGNLVTRDELLAIARGCDALVVVDERAIAFSGASVVDAIAEVENVLVVRSFSHAWPAAAFRLGYAIGRPRVVAELAKVRLAHTPAAPALLAGQVLLSRPDLAQDAIAATVAARDRLRHDLGKVSGLVSWPSAANYVLVGTTLPGEDLAGRLLDRGIAVKAFSRSPLRNCIRVTVGLEDEHQALVKALKAICGEVP